MVFLILSSEVMMCKNKKSSIMPISCDECLKYFRKKLESKPEYGGERGEELKTNP